MRILGSVLAAAVFTLICYGGALAAPVTFDFSGSVNQVNFDPADPFSGTIGFGTAFTGSYTFEATATDDVAASGSTGSYSMAGAPYGLSVNIGGNIFLAGDFLNIGVADNYPTGDQYTVLAQAASGGPLRTDLRIELFFEDPSKTVFGSDALPLTPPLLSMFTLMDFHLYRTITDASTYEMVQQDQIDGRIDSLSAGGAAPVPEPSTALLLGFGLAAGMFSFSRRRNCRQRNL